MTGARDEARRNRERIVEVARVVVREQGTQASLRDIARRAEVGLGTLYRHFPSRDALLETLMRRRVDHLTARATALTAEKDAAAALTTWLLEFSYGAGTYRGLPESLLATLADQTSPLHAAVEPLRDATASLLASAQAANAIRADLTADELFALVTAVGWIAEQTPTLDNHRERLLALILDGLTRPPRR